MSEESTDALIVGGGVVGLACAHYLERSGLSVRVIDQGAIAAACSHGNCGYICPSHVLPLTEPGAVRVALKSLFNRQAPFRVKPRWSPQLWNWLLQFGLRCRHKTMLRAATHLQAILDSSLSEYHQLMREESLDCQWQENGLLYVLQTIGGMREFAESDRLLREHFGVGATRIEGGELRDFDPALKDNLAGAFHYPGDTSVRPDLLNRSWRERLESRGVRFVENCELQQLTCRDRVLTTAMTSRGELSARYFVLAMGAWSTRWSRQLNCRIPIQPGKGYSVTMSSLENNPRYPILFPEHKVGVSPFADGLRLGSMMEFAGYDTSIPPARIQQLRDSARPYLACDVDGPAEETWFGWRPMTWDSLPIIGPVPQLANAFLATGHNMIGLTLAPATGRLIAELITGRSPHLDVQPYSVKRFS